VAETTFGPHPYRESRYPCLWRPADHWSSIVIPSTADTSAALHRPPRLGEPRKPFALVPETTFRAHPHRQSRNTCFGSSPGNGATAVIPDAATDTRGPGELRAPAAGAGY